MQIQNSMKRGYARLRRAAGRQPANNQNQNAPRPQRQRARQGQIYTTGQQSIGAAVTTTPVRSPTNAIRITGSDTISLIDNIQTVGSRSGQEVLNIRVSPSISPRLAQHAVCYNEIKYHSLTARINGQASSLTVGSVILAFCSDPSDVVVGDAISWARSQKCNASGKYWETIRVHVPHTQMHGPNDGFFKNNVGRSEAPRTYSPGFFSLIVISPANQETPLELQLEWDVTLRNPTFNPLVDEAPAISTALESFGISGSSTADVAFDPLLKIFGPGVATRDLLVTDFSPPLINDGYYTIPGGQVTIIANTGDVGAPEAVIATHIGPAAAGNGVLLYRYLITSGTYEPITATEISAKPGPSAAPTFRKLSEWPVDPDSIEEKITRR
nr:MAG: coat protein [brine shrimp tombus-like virus 1]